MKSGHCYDFGCCVVCAIATALRIPCVTFPLPSASNWARSSGDMRTVRLIDCPVDGRPGGRFTSVINFNFARVKASVADFVLGRPAVNAVGGADFDAWRVAFAHLEFRVGSPCAQHVGREVVAAESVPATRSP